MGGITGSFSVTAGTGLSGSGTPASPLSLALSSGLSADGLPAYFCRAWVNFNGSTLGIRGGANVSSVTRYATGDFSVNFSTAMPDGNYAAVCTGGAGNGGGFWSYTGGLYGSSYVTTTAVRVNNIQKNNGTYSDNELLTVMVMR
jgi:hypothetical protein